MGLCKEYVVCPKFGAKICPEKESCDHCFIDTVHKEILQLRTENSALKAERNKYKEMAKKEASKAGIYQHYLNVILDAAHTALKE